MKILVIFFLKKYIFSFPTIFYFEFYHFHVNKNFLFIFFIYSLYKKFQKLLKNYFFYLFYLIRELN
jgi:hypothetical protein